MKLRVFISKRLRVLESARYLSLKASPIARNGAVITSPIT